MAKDILVDLDLKSTSRLLNLLDPTLAQHAATKAYVDSAVEGLSWKASVRVASTANLNLAAPGTAIDGITLAVNDRFVAKDQTATAQNGIYVFNGSATPATRSADASTFNELEQAIVTAQEGTSNAATTWRQTQVNGTLETSSVAFTAFGTMAGAATETVAGIAEIATQAETDAGTDDLRIITPLKQATWSGRKRKTSVIFGDGSATSFNIDHNFNMRLVVVEVYKNSGNYDSVVCDVTRPTVNRVTLAFAAAPAASAYEVVIIG